MISKRQKDGGVVMIWACFSYFGKSNNAFLNGRQSSVDYCKTLHSSSLEFAPLNHGADWQFQQENVSINVSCVAKTWFDEENIDLIDWPDKHPTLDSVESVRSTRARATYSSGKKYEDAVS